MSDFQFERTYHADNSITVHVTRGTETRDFKIDGKEVANRRTGSVLGSGKPNHLFGFDKAFAASGMGSKLNFRADFIGGLAGQAFVARGDAATSYVLARDLEFVSAIVARQPLSALTSMDAIPMNVDQPKPFQEFYAYRNVLWSKGARVSRNYKDQGQKGDISVTKSSQAIAPSILSAQWGLDDVMRAALGEIPLPSLDLEGCYRWVNEDINNLNWFGDADLQITGIYNNAGIVKTSVTAWSGLAPDVKAKQFLALFTRIITAVKSSNNTGVDLRPNALRVSDSLRMEMQEAMSNVGFGGQAWTIEQYVMQQLKAAGGGNVTIESSPELEDNGSGDRWAMAYRKDPQVLGRLMPVAPTLLPPDIESALITQTVHAQSGGVSCRYPVAVQIIHGM